MDTKDDSGSTAVLLLAIVVLSAGSAWLRGTPASAGQPATAEAAETNDDLLTAGRTVHVRDEVRGDVAAAGAEIIIDGAVSGYVMGAARTVTVEGPVGNDVWAAGETVNVNTEIGNNAMLAGRFVYLGTRALIGHDARLAGSAVTAQGRVEGDLDIGAETARIGADVGGAVNARAERVTVLPGAVIRGDLFVRASDPPEIEPGAQVLGQLHYERTDGQNEWAGRWKFLFLALLTLGLAAVALSPAWPARVAGTLRERPSASVLMGVMVLVLIPLAIAALAVTMVGLPLALVLLALYVITLLLAGVFVSFRTGDWLLSRTHRLQSSRIARMILGVLVVSLAVSLPTVGLGIAVVVMMFGSGALVLERRSQRAPVGP